MCVVVCVGGEGDNMGIREKEGHTQCRVVVLWVLLQEGEGLSQWVSGCVSTVGLEAGV